MRVSEYFNLNRTQPSLDFVDVDVENDIRLFIDPRSFIAIPSDWGNECIALIRDYFSVLLRAIRGNNKERGLYLLGNLKEPKETGLGLSVQGRKGRGVGFERSEDLWEALCRSEAVQSGLVEDLEDTVLMIEGIGPDIISDITTNVIREPLIEYTQAVCQVYGIPIQQDIPSGPLWNPRDHSWVSNFVNLPSGENGKFILVPKIIIRYKITYDPGEYYRYYLLEELRNVELSANSGLVEVLKNNKRRVTTKALIEKYGTGKAVLVEQTLNHPDALRRYRSDKRLPIPPLSHIEFMRDPEKDIPNWEQLLNNVLNLTPGTADADNYEKAIEALLYALFYPALVNPESQHNIHEGRKRIDIKFANTANTGFFKWLSQHYRSPYVFVECKNYGREIGNPAIDQLAGYFSPLRGQCGILVCRSFENKDRVLERCRDSAIDHRGYIIALEDADLVTLVTQARQPNADIEFPLLRERFERLIM
jgi:hypothetical protein